MNSSESSVWRGLRFGASTGVGCQGTFSGHGRRQTELTQRPGDRGFQLSSIDDEIDEAFFEEELAALEALRQLLPDGLFNHTRPGESDQRLRFGDVQIAEHCKAGRDAPCG